MALINLTRRCRVLVPNPTLAHGPEQQPEKRAFPPRLLLPPRRRSTSLRHISSMSCHYLHLSWSTNVLYTENEGKPLINLSIVYWSYLGKRASKPP